MKNLLSYVLVFAAAVQVASSSPVGPFGSDVSTPPSPSDALTSAPPSASPALAARPSRSSDASTSAPPSSSSTLAAPASESEWDIKEWETKMEREFIMLREEVKDDLEDAKDDLDLKAIEEAVKHDPEWETKLEYLAKIPNLPVDKAAFVAIEVATKHLSWEDLQSLAREVAAAEHDPEWESTMENLERMLPNLSSRDVEGAFKLLGQYAESDVERRREELESRKQNELALRVALRDTVKRKGEEAIGKLVTGAGNTRDAIQEIQKYGEIARYCIQKLDIGYAGREFYEALEGLKELPLSEKTKKILELEDARQDQLRKELGLKKSFF